MKTMYLAIYGKEYAVKKINIIKETIDYVYVQGLRNYRLLKITKDTCVFNTELEAWQWLKDKARDDHNTAQRQADERLFIFNKIASLS